MHQRSLAATGTDARTVRRDAQRGAKVIGDLIRGTKPGTGSHFDTPPRRLASQAICGRCHAGQTPS